MQLGIFAKTFEGASPASVLGAAAAAGYAAVQYNMACSGIGALPTRVDAAVAAAVRDARAANGVAIAAISATYNMIHPDLSRRMDGRASFAAIAEQARAMGSRLLTVCTGSMDAADQWRHHPDNASSAAWATMMEEFGHLIEIADRHDLLIGVEPELANVVCNAVAARRLLDSVSSDRIGIILDPANLAEVESPDIRRRIIAEAVDLLGDKIIMAHAKDRNADGSFATAGKGVVDFPDFLGRLRGAGFNGPLVTHGLSADEAPGVASYLTSVLEKIG